MMSEPRGVVAALEDPGTRRIADLEVGRAHRLAAGGSRFGGDVLDVFQYGGGYVALTVVEMSGQGMTAGRNAGLAKYALRGFACQGLDARACVRAFNRLSIENSEFEDDETFAALFFAIVQPDRSAMQYVSAGNEAACLVNSGVVQALSATGPVIGLIDDDGAFEQRVVPLTAGSVIVAVADGFSQAGGAYCDLGARSLTDVIGCSSDLDAERLAEAVTRRAYELSNRNLEDDVAALVVRILPQSTPLESDTARRPDLSDLNSGEYV